MIGRIIICCLLFSLNATAQEQVAVDSMSTQEQVAVDSMSTQKSKSTLKTRLKQLQQYLDNKAKKKVDPNYI